MKICKFCGKKVKKLVDAHILPRAFFEYTRKKANLSKNQPMLGVTNTNGAFPKSTIRKGWHDSNLVCSTCEAIFKPYDDYAIKILVQVENMHTEIVINGELKGWEIKQIDNQKIGLFITSVLWRAGASKMPQFKKIKLGSKIEDIKQTILNKSSNDEVSFILARFSDRLGRSFILDPHPEVKRDIFGTIGVFRFYLGAGYIAFVKIGNKPFPFPANQMIASDNEPIRIISRGDFRSSKELLSLRKVLLDADEMMVKIKKTGRNT